MGQARARARARATAGDGQLERPPARNTAGANGAKIGARRARPRPGRARDGAPGQRRTATATAANK